MGSCQKPAKGCSGWGPSPTKLVLIPRKHVRNPHAHKGRLYRRRQMGKAPKRGTSLLFPMILSPSSRPFPIPLFSSSPSFPLHPHLLLFSLLLFLLALGLVFSGSVPPPSYSPLPRPPPIREAVGGGAEGERVRYCAPVSHLPYRERDNADIFSKIFTRFTHSCLASHQPLPTRIKDGWGIVHGG